MKKSKMSQFFTLIATFILLVFVLATGVNAVNAPTKQEIQNYTKSEEIENLTKEDLLNLYDEVTTQYSNEELARLLEENQENLQKQGISQEVVTAGANFIKTTDPKQIREIIEKDLDIEEIQDKIKQGYTPNQILKSVLVETPTNKKVEIGIKILLANQTVQTILWVILILFIYGTILRWIIYHKAGKHGWAAIIPFYRQIVMYQICNLTPLFMLLWFIPILGWLILIAIAITKRFYLAKAFGRGIGFGFGLLLLPPVFQSILAFHPNIEYEEE